MLKYFLILGGIIISFLSDIYESEKKEGDVYSFKLMKLTTSKKVFLSLGLIISIFGIWFAKNEEDESNLKVIEKAKKDSTFFANKNFRDSIRYNATIEEIGKTQRDVIEKARDIVFNTNKETDKLLVENRKIKYPIPETINITIRFELILNDNETKEVHNIIKKYYANLPTGNFDIEANHQNNILIGFPLDLFKDTSNIIINFLSELNETSFTVFDAYFKNKVDVTILRLSNRQIYPNKKITSVSYSSLERKIFINVELPEINILKSTYISSIFELERTKLIIDSRLNIIPNLSKKHHDLGTFSIKSKLIHTSFYTNGLFLSINDFKIESDLLREVRYVKRLAKNEIWKTEESSYEALVKMIRERKMKLNY